ncbi:hypothetical protein PAAG_12336 [Paracoccidioides lutzii Pb01]|uniref:Uncharacterized protein n=1 Tax=Paracoccidioides lutzii (strain ATCC MYA-826 / Pb01) TaxID=502779 RepID=A0A0A2VJ74_PARBA|nr:hypothetical protein PAAG_12336 [Paracoccidioides lutzii Pb01]KGQ00964.1 hypothetical protein PAAG_12336 [Paracoccidioides lutzii Pb01]
MDDNNVLNNFLLINLGFSLLVDLLIEHKATLLTVRHLLTENDFRASKNERHAVEWALEIVMR